jgi:hypothetical protein
LPSASVVIIVVISVFLEISLENPRQEWQTELQTVTK